MKRAAFFALGFAVLIATGCSKDKQLAKSLYGQEGTWNIDLIHFHAFISGTDLGEASDTDAGTIVFNKNGTGSYTYDYTVTFYFLTIPIPITVQRTGNFSWTAEDGTVTVPDGNGDLQVWNTSASDKKNQTWTTTLTEVDSFGNTITLDVRKEVTKQ